MIKLISFAIAVLTVLPNQVFSQENAKEWTGWPAEHMAAVFYLHPDSVTMDDNINKIFFDVTKFDLNNLESFYEAISFISTDRDSYTGAHNKRYIKKIEHGEKVNFMLNYSKLVEHLTRHEVEEFYLVNKDTDKRYKERRKIYAYIPDGLVLDFIDIILNDLNIDSHFSNYWRRIKGRKVRRQDLIDAKEQRRNSKEKLDNFIDKHKLNIPDSASDINHISVGNSIPKVTLRTTDSTTIDLNSACAILPTILIFYRGGWCPYCNRHLEALQVLEPDLLKLGYQIIAISPDRPEVMREHTVEKGFDYQLLSDSDMNAAKAFGLAFRVDDATLTRYTNKLNIDIEADSGYKHHLLPVPAVFIVGTDGVIRYSYVNPNYKVRIDADVLLNAAEEAAIK